MISHMLNTNVRSNIRPVLTNRAEDTQAGEYASFINQERVTIPDLIDRLLELSRIQAGTIDLQLEASQLGDIFRDGVEHLQALAPAHRLCIDIGADVLPVMVDPYRVQQVLTALVENAAKFAPEGSIIAISAYRQGGFIQINVADQGIGIAPEHRKRVFEAYCQPEYQMTPSAGLGLAISKGLVEILGGDIWISDRNRKHFHTTVCFTLPIVTASNWNRAMSRRKHNGFTSDMMVAEPYRMPV
jgi:two-component system sensor histidine kinase KdpD